MREPWSLRRALRDAVRRATARMRAHGHHDLADLVEADELQRIATAVDRTASRPWMDEFGLIHCPRCAGVINPPKNVVHSGVCPGHDPLPRRAHGIAA